MKRRLKVVSWILMLAMLFPTVASAATRFERTGFTTENLIAYAEDAIIIRSGNNECYVNNLRKGFDPGNKDTIAFTASEKIYVPADFLLEQLGFNIIENADEKIVAEIGGKQLTVSPTNGGVTSRVKDGVLFAVAEEVAEFAGVGTYSVDDLLVISKKIVDGYSIPDAVVEEMKRSLSYRWDMIFLGPLGYVTSIIQHPTSDVMYCRTDVGGMYRFDRKNNKWIQLLATLDYENRNLLGVRSVALDPNDDNIVYASCGTEADNDGHCLLKSYDRGENWEKLNFEYIMGGNEGDARLMAENTMVDPNNSNTIYVGTLSDGLFVSHDAGVSWAHIDSVPNKHPNYIGGITCVYIDSRKTTAEGLSSDVYVGVGGEGIYVSRNGGASFTKLEGGPGIPCEIQMVGDKLYASGTKDRKSDTPVNVATGFYVYENGAWTNLTPVRDAYSGTAMAFMIDRRDPNFIWLREAPYVGTADFRSFDGGKTWEYMGNNGNACTVRQDVIEEDGVWLTNGVGIQFGMNFKGDYKRVDRWSGVEELVCREVMSLPAAEAPVVHTVVMDHGMIINDRLDVKGKIVKPSTGHGSDVDFCEEDPSMVVFAGLIGSVSTSQGRIAVSTDYGSTYTDTTWVKSNRAMDVAVGATKKANGYPTILAISGTGEQGMFRSNDYGQTWERIDAITGWETNAWRYYWMVLASDRVNGNVFYYIHNNVFYVSKDSGTTWKATMTLPAGDGIRVIKAIPGVEGGVVYKAGVGLYISYDYGYTWSRMKDMDKTAGFGFGIGKPGSDLPALYAAGYVNDVYGIYLSDDLGESWRRINDNANGAPGADVNDICGDRRIYGRVYASSPGAGTVFGQPIGVDDHPPLVTIDNQSSDDSFLNYATNEKNIVITGKTDETAEVRVNGKKIETDLYNNFSYPVELKDGENHFMFEAMDESGNFSDPVELMIRYDADYLGFKLDSEAYLTKDGKITITGQTSHAATIKADTVVLGNNVTGENNLFEATATVTEAKTFKVYAVDANGVKSNEIEVKVDYDNVKPEVTLNTVPETTVRRLEIISGKMNEPGDILINGKTVKVRDDLSFFYSAQLEDGINSFRIQGRDKAKNATEPKVWTINKKTVEDYDTARIDVPRAGENFKFDGDLSDWNLDKYGEKIMNGTVNNQMRFSVMYDDEYLYVATEVIDDVVIDKEPVYQGDCFEVYIDADNSKDASYGPGDKQYSFGVRKEYKEAIYKETSSGYTFEVRIPWAEYGVIPRQALKVGFDCNITENDGTTSDSNRDGILGWHGTSSNYKDTSVFSTLFLGE